MNKRVLIVEDDIDMALINELILVDEGYLVHKAHTGKAALEAISGNDYDVILLDVMLPDYFGQELCEKIRERYKGPIIFMSCLGDSQNIVQAFRSGGNDYLVKPVKREELLERIVENLHSEDNGNGLIVFEQFIIDDNLKIVYRRLENGDRAEDLGLSPTEFKLLKLFTEKQNDILLYKELYSAIWDQGDMEDVRALMVHISNLRKKIDYRHNDSIKSIRNVGYIFRDV